MAGAGAGAGTRAGPQSGDTARSKEQIPETGAEEHERGRHPGEREKGRDDGTGGGAQGGLAALTRVGCPARERRRPRSHIRSPATALGGSATSDVYVRLKRVSGTSVCAAIGCPTGHREDLLEGAKRCLLEKGYGCTTARDIVAASGANLASIGYHYGSKDALMRQAIIASSEEWGAWCRPVPGRFDEAVPEDAGPLERFAAVWDSVPATDRHGTGVHRRAGRGAGAAAARRGPARGDR